MRTVMKLMILISIIPIIFLSGCGKNSSTAEGISSSVSLSGIASLVKEDGSIKKGNITGIIDERLLASMQCNSSKTVYIFQGHNVPPDDIDTSDPNPVQSIRVVFDSVSRRYGYSAYSLTEGDYTIAFTCQADRDSPLHDDYISFGGMKNVTVSGGKDIIGHLFI